ncbi:MAG TPA: ABC transporter substrate-binding protein [Streptosporangiaceae bacterium]|nr:ABC transporter substrate-binding protein [Streptosporangiaceae bacterium]
MAATGGSVSALAAKTATATIPIVFISGLDPVETGLVSSLNRPGGNATGVSVYTADLVQKRLELLRDLVPGAATIALLVSAASSAVKFEKEHLEQATRRSGLKLLVLEAGSESDFEPAFASAVEQGAGAILISADPYFTGRRAQIVALATRYRLPAAYPWRAYAEAGGLMSYGPPLAWAYKQIGTYASRILKGVKPGDLPVQLPTTFELVINLETAKALGLTVSRWLLASADEVIE